MKNFNIYKLISIVAFLVLIFILALPSFFNINEKKNTEECIKNMKIIYKAVERYMEERNLDFNGTQRDLRRTGYLKKTYVCPSGRPDDKYYIEGNHETSEIIVRCPLEEELPDHKLPESIIE
ncbi:MAG: hypothetical protein PWQ09_97 [Candidatus Cloacimonadota bacterium]|jgi:competence protein ComGC|nr:hypothetical protein [Candidatus Cloacimonadota bacterium]